jgi:hypothetical protein
MAWVRTVPLSEAEERLKRMIEAQERLYPQEYAAPVQPTGDGAANHRGVARSHPGGALIMCLRPSAC